MKCLIPIISALFGAVLTFAQPQTFNYTGAVQTYTVPACVYSVDVDVKGAEGAISAGGCTGGLGGRIRANLSVTPGQVLNIYVGQKTANNAGGYNGGGAGGTDGGGGGGASDIRIGGTALSNRVIVAGGGGGGAQLITSTNYWGGPGGGTTGGAGYYNGTQGGSYPGKGGTQTAGGAAGTATFSGTAGTLGVGGLGGETHGGGGGGGYYGGGGGSSYGNGGAGGGGGSSYAGALARNVVHNQGVQGGNGQIVITPIVGTPAPTSITGAYEGCRGDTLLYFCSKVATATEYSWTVPDSSVLISGQGTDSIRMIVGELGGLITVKTKGSCGESTPVNHQFGVKPGPASKFVAPATAAINVSVNFTDSSKKAKTWLWDFGDGDSSTEQNPSHTYTVSDTFTVKLSVSDSDSSCTHTSSQQIVITGTAGLESGTQYRPKIYPQPSRGTVNIELEQPMPDRTQFGIMDQAGRLVWTGHPDINEGKIVRLEIFDLNSGNYVLSIKNGQINFVHPIMLLNE